LRDRQFYVGVALFMIAFNAVAFGRPIVNPSTRIVPLPLTALVMAHAVVSASWLFLFLAQAAGRLGPSWSWLTAALTDRYPAVPTTA
jgi:hypothetical protein